MEVSFWVDANLTWLQEGGVCLNRISSHDPFSQFFRFVDLGAFEKRFINLTQRIAKVVDSVIALDGETICN